MWPSSRTARASAQPYGSASSIASRSAVNPASAASLLNAYPFDRPAQRSLPATTLSSDHTNRQWQPYPDLPTVGHHHVCSPHPPDHARTPVAGSASPPAALMLVASFH